MWNFLFMPLNLDTERAVEPQNAQKSHKNQVLWFVKDFLDLVITQFVSIPC
jgi:hypothetical protein